MVRVEGEILDIAGGFSVEFGSQCRHLPDDQNIQEKIHTAWLYISMVSWMVTFKLLWLLRKFL
jgi:hypothetical protein